MKISSEQLKKDIDYLSVFLEDKEQIDAVSYTHLRAHET